MWTSYDYDTIVDLRMMMTCQLFHTFACGDECQEEMVKLQSAIWMLSSS